MLPLLILLKCSHLVFLKCKSYPVISFLNIKTAQDFPFPLGESSEVAAGLCFTRTSECLMAVPGCADTVPQPGDAPGSPVRQEPPPYSLSCAPLLGSTGQGSMRMKCSPMLPSPFSHGLHEDWGADAAMSRPPGGPVMMPHLRCPSLLFTRPLCFLLVWS